MTKKDYKDISLQELIAEDAKTREGVKSEKAEAAEETAEQSAPSADESMLPKPPTGTRINKRGKNLILLVGGVLGAYIVWAVFGLSPKAPTATTPTDATSLSSDALGKQQEQGQSLLNNLQVQAYGSASAQPQGASGSTGGGNGNLPIPAGATNQAPGQNNLPGNLSAVAPSATTASQGSSSGSGFFGGGGMSTQTPQQQAVQSGMQSGLTPDGFQSSANSMPSSTSAQPALNNGGAALTAPSAAGSDNQNMQGEKNAFLQQAQSASQSSLQNGVQNPASPYMIMAGSVIPATLITGIDSDLPGQIQAIVSQNIYDSRSGNSVLIPQGSRLVGAYDSQVAYGQSRVLIVWSRIIFPNDQSIDLEGMPGADLSGFAGLHDQVDNHYLRIYGSALLMSLFSAGMQLSQPQASSTNGNAPSNQQIIAGAMGQQLGQTATQMIQQNLNIQPTLNIRSGDNFNVLVTRDIPFTTPYSNGGKNS